MATGLPPAFTQSQEDYTAPKSLTFPENIKNIYYKIRSNGAYALGLPNTAIVRSTQEILEEYDHLEFRWGITKKEKELLSNWWYSLPQNPSNKELTKGIFG